VSRRLLKVAAWAAVFLTCAGIGAFVAAQTDPFPPGVDDPGLRPTPSTGTDAPGLVTWPAVLSSRISWWTMPGTSRSRAPRG
jgi:hypothetical protein